MQIVINDTNELSHKDLQVLQVLVGATPAGPVATVKEAKPAKKAAAPTPEPEPEAAEPEAAEPEPEVEADSDDAPTMQDAVALATELVGKGRTKEVKSVLTDLGAKKVSELSTDEKISDFVERARKLNKS